MPTMNSLKYLAPIELKTNTTVKAGLFKNNELKEELVHVNTTSIKQPIN